VPAPLLVVDAPSLLFRAFHALPDSIVEPEGKRSVHALLGTANLLLFEIERWSPRAVVLCFGEEAAHYCTEAYPAYHADRVDLPDGLQWQWGRSGDFFGAFGFHLAVSRELEADDLLGSYAAAEEEAGAWIPSLSSSSRCPPSSCAQVASCRRSHVPTSIPFTRTPGGTSGTSASPSSSCARAA
jgi:5'-3' exonuclease